MLWLKKKLCFLLTVIFCLTIFANIVPVKAYEAIPKIAFLGIEHSPLISGETEAFSVVSVNCSEKVQYRFWLNKEGSDQWVDIGNGYLEPVDANSIFQFNYASPFEEGRYKLSVWVKRAGQTGEKSNKMGSYDNYYVSNISCTGKDDLSRVFLQGNMNVKYSTYAQGEEVEINGIEGISGMKPPYSYKLHAYNASSNEWLNNLTPYGSSTKWIPDKEGEYVLDLWAMSSDSKLWSREGELNGRIYEAWKLKKINVEKAVALDTINGIFGSDSSLNKKIIDGNVNVKGKGIYLKNTIVKGNLYTTGDNVTLENVEVLGTLVIHTQENNVTGYMGLKADKKEIRKGALVDITPVIHPAVIKIVSAVTANPAPGTYADPQNVALSSATAGADIWYTVDGTDPTASTTRAKYTAPIAISSSATIKAYASKPGMTDSNVSQFSYAIQSITQVGAVIADPVPGIYTEAKNITLSTSTAGADIWYTVDGTDPITSTTRVKYAAPITISSSATIKAYAVKSGMTDSVISEFNYVFKSAEIVQCAAAGGGHTLFVKNGEVWYLGYDDVGAYTTYGTDMPKKVNGLSNIVSVSAGWFFSVALKDDGTVWTWGHNNCGQLGNGNTTPSPVPAQVQGLNNVVAISAGNLHVLAIKNDGTVWAWGNNNCGQCGTGNDGTEYKTLPIQVKDSNGNNLTDIKSISAGTNHSLALSNDGTVWAWGSNHFGQLGITSAPELNSIYLPVQVKNTDGTGYLSGVESISAGIFHSAAVIGGNVYTWGRNTEGQLGACSTRKTNSLPVKVDNIDNVVLAAAGADAVLVSKNDGTIMGWGYNVDGTLGVPKDTLQPSMIDPSILSNVILIDIGSYGTVLAVKGDGTLWGWGFNTNSQLEHHLISYIYSPVQLTIPSESVK